MTENGEEVRRGGRHRGGSSGGDSSRLDSGIKADPSRPREDEDGRRRSSTNGRDGAKVRASGAGEVGGASYVNGNSTMQMDEVNISIGEVDYTDGEMGSVTSSFSGSSPLSSVGSGGGSGGGGTRRVSSGSNGIAGRGAGSSSSSGSSNGSAYKVRNKNNGPSSAGSSSNGAGGQAGNVRGNSSSSSSSGTNGAQAIPGVAARPAGVPFGASALSKNMPNNGRGRPRGLRPRSSGGSGSGTPGSGISSTPHRVPSFSASSAAPPSSAGRHAGGQARSAAAAGENSSSRRPDGLTKAEAAAAEMVAPGVPVEVVVRAAVKIESVMRVLIARGYVRRKLVSEVTAFSLIMERGIEVIKHPFSGKGKAKNVTVNFVSRKGAMLLSWGGKSGVPLETIFGVTKGINTDALRAAVDPERSDNCFSLHTNDRTIDFEVDNPWLVLLVVRALRLFLGAHYDTLPAPTFFSHLCVRPRSSDRADTPKQTMVWTSVDKSPSSSKEQQTTRSTPTERTSGDSASDDGNHAGGSGSGRRPSPWDGQDAGDGDSDSGSALHDVTAASIDDDSIQRYPPPPDGQAPGAGEVGAPAGTPPRAPTAGEGGAPPTDFVGDVYGDGDDENSADRSPGGVMALFSSGGRRVAEQISIGGAGGGPGSIPRSATSGVEGFASSSGGGETGTANGTGTGTGAPGVDEPLTASQLLATRGMSKRLSLSKKLSAAANNNSGPLKGKRFDLMALPMDPAGQQDRRDRAASELADAMPKRNQGMSISIGAGYDLPEEKHRDDSSEVETDGGRSGAGDSGRVAVVDDLNDKLQSLRRLCVPQARPTSFRPGRAPKTMAVKHMALFSGLGGSGKGGGGNAGGGLGSVADMWGDGVRRQYQTDMVRQKNQSVEDVHKRDSVRTAMLVNRSGVHRVTRKAAPPESR